MATLLIRNLDDTVRDRLRVRAAEHGHSMEEEARTILADAIEQAENDPDAQFSSGAALLARLREGLPPDGVEFPEFPDQIYEPRPVWEDEPE